jgi:hypothetical protein
MFCDVFYVRTFGNITLTSFGIDSTSESNTEACFGLLVRQLYTFSLHLQSLFLSLREHMGIILVIQKPTLCKYNNMFHNRFNWAWR